MPTRRRLLLAAAALPLAVSARAQGTDAATALIEKLGRDLVAVVNGGGANKAAALERIVDRDVDVQGVARFCLGRYWRTATPGQQTEYLGLFRRLLIRNITGRVGEYQGVAIAVGRGLPREGGEVAVSSTVTRPNNAPNKVDWIVATEGGAPKIVDVVAEGTSLRLTQRSDYSAFLQQNGGKVDALIEALKKQGG